MNLDLVRNVLLRIDEMKVGQTIIIDDLNKEFQQINSEDFLTLISKLILRYYIRVDGKWSHECYNLEKYNKLLGLDKDGLEAIDYLKNDKVWNKVQNYLTQNEYDNFTIFTAVELAKKIVNKEFDNIINN